MADYKEFSENYGKLSNFNPKRAVNNKTRVDIISDDSSLPVKTMETSKQYRQLVIDTYNDNLQLLRQNLVSCLDKIEDEVLKGYLEKIDRMPVVPLDNNIITQLPDIQFFQITELVCQEGELSVSKLATLYSSFCDKPCTLVLRISSDGVRQKIYLGVRSRSEYYSTNAMKVMLQQGLEGLFPGTQSQAYYAEDLAHDMTNLNPQAFSSVTCVADFRQNEDQLSNEKFIQGLEKFIVAMSGKTFDAFFIADNIMREQLMHERREYENISTQLSPFVTMNLSFNDSRSESKTSGTSKGKIEGVNVSNGVAEGVSQTLGSSVSHTEGLTHTEGSSETKTQGTTDVKGTTQGKSEARTEGKNDSTSINGAGVGAVIGAVAGGVIGSAAGPMGTMIGAQIGGAILGSLSKTTGKSSGITNSTSHTYSESKAISEMLSRGISRSDSSSKSDSKSFSQNVGKNTNRSVTQGMSTSISFVDTDTLGETIGTSKGITLTSKNRALQSIIDRLEKQLERIDACESLGMWNFAAYFTGEGAADTELAANIYRSVVSGQGTGVQYTAINTWQTEEQLAQLMPYVKNFLHPWFGYQPIAQEGLTLFVTPAVPVSTKELSIHMGLPNHSVCGLPVVTHAVFGQEVIRHGESRTQVRIGSLYHLGRELPNNDIGIDLDSLTMHTFVSGSTGAGKSNAVYSLLAAMQDRKIPFLVVEPAKGEYRKVFTDVACYGTNPQQGNILHINPFSFPKQIHVLEHIDRLVEIFSVCWPLYAAMPAVLKQAVERAYCSAGWDIGTSVNSVSPFLFPTFEDVLRELDSFVNESAYSNDTKGDYVGALSTRLASLTSGLNGQIFSGIETPAENLFDQSAILDLSRVGATETKSLLMGLIVLKLQEYRMTQGIEMNAGLRHLTILEEAHNLLKKTSTEQSSESSNVTGKSVEMITNAIAEMRTFGEGFVIVDQAPNLLDTAAIRNTNTKIILRLPEGGDRESIGASMALNTKQINEVSKLPTGVAVVYQNNWQEAVLVKLPRFERQQCVREISSFQDVVTESGHNVLLHLLLKNKLNEEEMAQVKDKILHTNVAAKIRKDLFLHITDRNQVFQWALADFISTTYDCSDALRGTGSLTWNDWQELADIMLNNIKPEFQEFDTDELHKILLCICRVEQEHYPDNRELKNICTEYLQKEVSFA